MVHPAQVVHQEQMVLQVVQVLQVLQAVVVLLGHRELQELMVYQVDLFIIMMDQQHHKQFQ
jgi:hypothetical protein